MNGIAVEYVSAVRQAVGPDVDLLIEVHRRLAPDPAVRVAGMMEDCQVFWYDEPVSARNLDALAEVCQAINLPVVTGEELYTKAEFRQVFEKRAADILSEARCLQLWRYPGTKRDRGHGGTVPSCHLTTQLQQHNRGIGCNDTGMCGNAELPDY